LTTEDLVKVSEEPTDPKHGWDPSKRPIDQLLKYGLIPLD